MDRQMNIYGKDSVHAANRDTNVIMLGLLLLLFIGKSK